MKFKYIIGLILVVLLIVGAFGVQKGWFGGKGQKAADTGSNTLIVNYTNTGFSPQTITIKKGQTVTWINSSMGEMWVASAAHPSHKLYSGTSLSEHCPDASNSSFDECKGDPGGSTWTFTFNKVGTWNYHDHINPSAFGTVVVQ